MAHWFYEEKTSRRRTPADFLDIGIMVYARQELKHISIYIPLSKEQFTVSDLGPRLSDISIVTGIFNEQLTVETSDNRVIDLKNKDRHFSRVYIFSQNNRDEKPLDEELQIGKLGGGTEIKITNTAISHAKSQAGNLPRLDSKKKLYFRLRLSFNNQDIVPFVNSISPSDRYFLSGYRSEECIDFRANEARNLPVPVQRRITADEGSQESP